MFNVVICATKWDFVQPYNEMGWKMLPMTWTIILSFACMKQELQITNLCQGQSNTAGTTTDICNKKYICMQSHDLIMYVCTYHNMYSHGC